MDPAPVASHLAGGLPGSQARPYLEEPVLDVPALVAEQSRIADETLTAVEELLRTGSCGWPT